MSPGSARSLGASSPVQASPSSATSTASGIAPRSAISLGRSLGRWKPSMCGTSWGLSVRAGSGIEESLSEVLPVAGAGWDREDRGPDRGGPLVEQVELVQALLDGDELSVDVGLERDEQQPRVRQGTWCGSGVVVVGPPQEPLLGVVGA